MTQGQQPPPPIGAPPGWTAEQVALASQAEIAAGRLPLTAQWRIAAHRQAAAEGNATFSSALSVDEFAALRSVGFTPVGQVMGSAVYNIGWYYGCGYSYGGGLFGGFAGPAPVVDVPNLRQLLHQARHRAVERMRQECAGLGGDGVVGVRLTVGSFYGNGLEFVAIGTAVRELNRGADRTGAALPFTSDLSGQDFAKLVHGGWLPVALVMGFGATLRHDDWALRSQQRSWMNQEMAGATELVQVARAVARDSLVADARRYGGETVVVRDMVLNVVEVRCRYGGDDAHDHLADAFIWGTTIVPFAAGRQSAKTKPLTIMRLDQERGSR